MKEETKEKFEDVIKIIGGILGALLGFAFLFVTAIGGYHSCTWTKDSPKIEREIDKQFILLHWLPKSTRYGIYEVEKFFSGEKEDAEEEEEDTP